MKELKEVLHYYLPYNVKIIISHRNQPDFEGNLTLPYLADCTGVKPILHPLSSVNKDDELWDLISYNTKSTILREDIKDYLKINAIRFGDIEELLRHHIDIFGLIESGQAIEK